MLRPGLIGMFATVQLYSAPITCGSSGAIFAGIASRMPFAPYTSIGNVVNNGYRPDSTAYYIIQTVAHTSLKKRSLK